MVIETDYFHTAELMKSVTIIIYWNINTGSQVSYSHGRELHEREKTRMNSEMPDWN